MVSWRSTTEISGPQDMCVQVIGDSFAKFTPHVILFLVLYDQKCFHILRIPTKRRGSGCVTIVLLWRIVDIFFKDVGYSTRLILCSYERERTAPRSCLVDYVSNTDNNYMFFFMESPGSSQTMYNLCMRSVSAARLSAQALNLLKPRSYQGTSLPAQSQTLPLASTPKPLTTSTNF